MVAQCLSSKLDFRLNEHCSQPQAQAVLATARLSNERRKDEKEGKHAV